MRQQGAALQGITAPKALYTLMLPVALLDTTAPLELLSLCPALLEPWKVRQPFLGG